MDWVIEAFGPAFMQRALAAGLLATVVTALVGTWVVLRGLAFLGDALAHGLIPGVAVAMLIGIHPVIGALGAAALMAGLVTAVAARSEIREDTGIGLLFVGMLALGVVIVSRSTSFATDVTALLFGDILGVTSDDLMIESAAVVLVGGLTVALYRPLLALAFNRHKAATLGLHPAAAQFALLALLAVSIVASFQAIGTLLVFGLLIGPPSTALLLVRRVPAVMGVAVLVGALSVFSGLLISYHAGTAGGATIAGMAVSIFFLVASAQVLAGAVRRRLGTTGSQYARP